MTNQQILEKAIQKAIKGGYINGIQWASHITNNYAPDYNYSGLIFNHDFAKALWPGEIYLMEYATDNNIPTEHAWQYHLKRMVLADDPIKYLGDNI